MTTIRLTYKWCTTMPPRSAADEAVVAAPQTPPLVEGTVAEVAEEVVAEPVRAGVVAAAAPPLRKTFAEARFGR